MAPGDRHNVNNQGRSLKPTLGSTRNTKSPLTPRLAAHPTVSSSTAAGRPANKSASTVSKAPPVEDSDTPVKAVLSSNITPRSSSRKSRVGALSPALGGDDTPSLGRAKTLSPTGELQGVPARSESTLDSRLQAASGRSKSLVNGKETVRLPALRLAGRADGTQTVAGRRSGENSPQFFHASDARRHEPALKKTEPKKNPTFVYANGREEETRAPSSKAPSPVLSAVSEKRSPGLFLHANVSSEPIPSPSILSPPLSSTSAASPFFPPPASSASSVSARPASPPKESIHLSYRKGVSQIFGVRLDRQHGTSPGSVLPGQSPFPDNQNGQQKPSLGLSGFKKGHVKSSSVSSIESGASHRSRRRSQTAGEVPASGETTVDDRTAEDKAQFQPQRQRPILRDIDTKLASARPSVAEPSQSPLKTQSDFAADARRERKVLDLEISNSSLLAINKSLEREMRKQKAELKRYRRLSRAGQFSVPEADRPVRRLSSLDEEGDLPDFDDIGRTSSPFEEEVGDLSEEDSASVTSSAAPLSPTAQADSDARYRARDQKRLQIDLEKHRELLLDTQKMNQSLKRCLCWTEDLIRDGRKALDHQVRSADVRLGGRILTEDDRDDASVAATEDDTLHANKPNTDSPGALGIWQHHDEFSGPSFDGEGTDRDSGIEADHPTSNFGVLLQQLDKLLPNRPSDGLGEIW